MPTPEEVLAMKLRAYPARTTAADIQEISGRPDINELYNRLSSIQGKVPDYTNVAEMAKARAAGGNRDFLGALALSQMGGEGARPLAQALGASGLEEAKPLRMNAADMGYINPDTGEFVENPLARQTREEKVISSRIDALVKEQESKARIAIAQGNAVDAQSARANADALRQMMAAITAQQAVTNAMLAEARATKLKSGGSDGKRMNLGEQRDLTTAVTEFQNLSRLRDSFKDEYAGGMGGTSGTEAANYVARNFPQALEVVMPKKDVDAMRERATFWADQKYFDELPTRHALFGSALTAPETRSWKGASIQPGMKAEDIRRNLKLRADLAEKAIRRVEQFHISNKVLPDAVYAITGEVTGNKKQEGPGATGDWSEIAPGIRVRTKK